MSEGNNQWQRRPRSASRRMHVGAQIGGQWTAQANEQRDDEQRQETFLEMAQAQGTEISIQESLPLSSGSHAEDDSLWEDTSTLLAIPEHKTFWSKQPRAFWIAAAILLVALCTVMGFIGVNMWREADLARKEARRLQALAEEKAKYKYLHRNLIETYADQNNIDPALVAAVIYNESRFEPNAVSSVGARGLMQIMEETGPWIAEKLNESDTYTFDSLFIPETNIRFGTWYLGYLSRRFGGDPVKIAAGYHAGQGRVAGWLADTAYSHDGWTLDVIPIPETEQYVRRVVNAYEIYKKHYYTPQEGASESTVS